MKTGVIILAAGAASRMGEAKMLLPFGNCTIVEALIDEVRTIKPYVIGLVTGCYHQLIADRIDTHELNIIFNKDWKEGMASSIRKGVMAINLEYPDLDALFLLVSDQPFVSSALLVQMIDLKEKSQKGIIAAKYAGIEGTPVLFDRHYFERLKQLIGDKGARSVLIDNREDLETLDFEKGIFDIDTPEAYKSIKDLLDNSSRN